MRNDGKSRCFLCKSYLETSSKGRSSRFTAKKVIVSLSKDSLPSWTPHLGIEGISHEFLWDVPMRISREGSV